MPLVVPGLMGTNKDDSTKWENELIGKQLGDQTNETTFAKKDLPKEHRVVREGDMMTMDHKPDRLNIHVGEDGTVTNVKYG
ncbi:hypothetical protein M501DRAFT_1013645 [Patellaria atrata CBS 101060]|uniref:Proteinase inhibitor I78 n=1 Tax=Patellaria atrata CBS 101060 TaxID=1346257 RepID=A0A9P4VUS5_9PEZI|nr:hypothetical protein M501DRAFT_1013645 [Patellaria atrata CBS 101060]